MVLFPNRIRHFRIYKIKNDQALASLGRLKHEQLSFRRVSFWQDPLRHDATIHHRVAHRFRSAAMSEVLSGKKPRFSIISFWSRRMVSNHLPTWSPVRGWKFKRTR